MIKLLSLFIPMKRLVWVEARDGNIYLGKLRRDTNPFSDGYHYYIYYMDWRWLPGLMEMGIEATCWGENVKIRDWGEFRPWWKPQLPPQEDPDAAYKIRINEKARRIKDGRLRKTRTLPQVWEQG